MPTSILFPMCILIDGSNEPDTVNPSGEEMGLSIADSAGLILKSWMLPAGLLMLRIETMWLKLCKKKKKLLFRMNDVVLL